jgi:beta-glucosidase
MKGRTYRYMTEKPQYPFGFGLSYTTFNFDSITLSAPSIATANMSHDETVTAAVTVSNTGKRNAEEVVQIYVAKDDRGADDPLCSLRAFRRVFIPAGKSVSVEFDLSAAAFETINEKGETVLVPGSYTIIAANAAPVPVSTEKGAPLPVQTKIKVV